MTTLDMSDPDTRVYVHLAQLKGAIRLEGLGIRHSSRRSALKYAKDLYGFTGNREKVLTQIENRMQEILAKRQNPPT